MSLLKLVGDSKEGRWLLVVVFTPGQKRTRDEVERCRSEKEEVDCDTRPRLDQLYGCLVVALCVFSLSKFVPDGRSCCVPCCCV